MIRKTFKILHIPSAEMLIVKTSHSKNFAQFEEEFKIAGQFIVAPTPSIDALIELTKILKQNLRALGLIYPLVKYPGANSECQKPNLFFKEPFWVYDLADFTTTLMGLSDKESIDVPWQDINLDEFEILE